MFDPTHVPAASMTADVLTKWLSLNDFAKHRGKLTNRRARNRVRVQQQSNTGTADRPEPTCPREWVRACQQLIYNLILRRRAEKTGTETS